MVQQQKDQAWAWLERAVVGICMFVIGGLALATYQDLQDGIVRLAVIQEKIDDAEQRLVLLERHLRSHENEDWHQKAGVEIEILKRTVRQNLYPAVE